MKKKENILIALSIAAAVISAVVSVGKMDIFGLAGTQWILISIVLGVYGLFFKGQA